MQIISNINNMRKTAEEIRKAGKIIGFVPTMGYLHEGHLSLIRLCRKKCDVLVVSIFVNPTQFGPQEDYEKYPRDFHRDEKLCQSENVDIIFYPSREEMYPEPHYTYVTVEKLSDTMCGLSRPGHFRGVATIVAKLFNVVKPHLAVFGEKDYQQALIIKQMVRDLNFDVTIITGPIVREPDGLAMSSRNAYLNAESRENALVLYKSLQLARKLVEEGVRNATMIRLQMEQLIRETPGASLDYIAIVDARTLEPVKEIRGETLIAMAVFIDRVRLIDNIVIKLP
ncbi:MAG: pantoate--beta-alanine ligase [Calditrichia bacterium]